MSPNELVAIIMVHGLSLRQIPLRVAQTYEIQHFQEGDEIVESKPLIHINYDVFKQNKAGNPNYKFYDETKTVTRLWCRRYRIPNNAGYWMCKQVANTDSMVRWSIEKDHLAPTLEESVKKFIDSIPE